MSLGSRIKEARRASIKSQQAVADHFGISRAAVSQWESDQTTPTIDRIISLANFLNVDLALLTNTHGPHETAQKPPQSSPILPPLEQMPRDVPVLGTARGGRKGSFLLNEGEPIDWVRRPPGIMKASDIYSIYVEGDSMADRFLPGDLVYAHPHKKVKIGDYVIVQRKTRDGQTEAYIKKLKRRTASKVFLEQTNPPETLEMPEKTIVSMHLILTLNDLMGV